LVTTQHSQFTAGLSRFGPAGTPSRASYHQGVAQSAGRAKTRQPGLLVKPAQIVLSSYQICSLLMQLPGVSSRKWRKGNCTCRSGPWGVSPLCSLRGNSSAKHGSAHGAGLGCRVLASSQLLLLSRTVEPLQSGNKILCRLRLAMVRRTVPGSGRLAAKPRHYNPANNANVVRSDVA